MSRERQGGADKDGDEERRTGRREKDQDVQRKARRRGEGRK